MERLSLTPRQNWVDLVEQAGMVYHTIDDELYWDESACYRFTAAEIDTLDLATAELQRLCIEVAERIISDGLFDRLGIPARVAPSIISSWERDDPSIYGRFDLAYDGSAPPKLLEYNADTPTSVLEASVVQWFWLRDCFPDADQYNSIHEKLIASWKEWPGLTGNLIHFACAEDSSEDLGNLEYLRDTAIQAGMETRRLFMSEIGWDEASRLFVDLHGDPIRHLFKLYPWEWLIREEFSSYLDSTPLRTIEPPWKMLLSNKGILPLLWEMFPGHPNLLEAKRDDNPMTGDYVRKPLFSREGENIIIRRRGEWVGTSGTYGEEGYVYQRYVELPCFDGNYPVIGSWIIGGEPAGIGIREDRSEITTNGSRFIPHYFEESSYGIRNRN
jgi:glutathionylspermidine synthase